MHLNIYSYLMTFSVVLLCATANAQSLNVDLDVPGADPPLGGGAPSSSFGAAASQAGFWNAVEADGTQAEYISLQDLTGNLSSVELNVSGPGEIDMAAVRYTPNTGDYALLLNDFAGIRGGGVNVYTFGHIRPGDYLVYTYAVRPNPQQYPINVEVDGSLDGIQTVSGPMPGNSFALGVTHSIHHVHVTDQTLVITAESSNFNAVINGFQIVAVPEPTTAVCVLSGGLILVKRKKSKRRS